jgi:hypothetical protein
VKDTNQDASMEIDRHYSGLGFFNGLESPVSSPLSGYNSHSLLSEISPGQLPTVSPKHTDGNLLLDDDEFLLDIAQGEARFEFDNFIDFGPEQDQNVPTTPVHKAVVQESQNLALNAKIAKPPKRRLQNVTDNITNLTNDEIRNMKTQMLQMHQNARILKRRKLTYPHVPRCN